MNNFFKTVILNSLKALPAVVPEIEKTLNSEDDHQTKQEKVDNILTDIEDFISLIRGAFTHGNNK